MIRLDRSVIPEPTSLSGPSTAVTTQAAEALAYYAPVPLGGPYPKAYKFTAYRDKDVRDALRDLGHGKCAYCESRIGGVAAREVEHYRPKGGVKGEKHSGYWWLAFRWDNLLPTCRGCNQRLGSYLVTPEMTPDDIAELRKAKPTTYGKGTFFPIGGTRAVCATDNHDLEDPLLMDPTRRDPGPELVWRSDGAFSVIVPARDAAGATSPYGEHTIACCALNRVELVEDRTAILNELKYERDKIFAALESEQTDPKALERALARATDMRRRHEPESWYSAMVKAYVDNLIDELAAWRAQRKAA